MFEIFQGTQIKIIVHKLIPKEVSLNDKILEEKLTAAIRNYSKLSLSNYRNDRSQRNFRNIPEIKKMLLLTLCVYRYSKIYK